MRLFVLVSAALISAPGIASAQSVLERVLGQIDGATNLAPVNGVFANIAESVNFRETIPGGSSPAYWSTSSGDAVTDAQMSEAFDIAQEDFLTAFTEARPIVPQVFTDPFSGETTVEYLYYFDPSNPGFYRGYTSPSDAFKASLADAKDALASDPVLSDFTAWQAATYTYVDAVSLPDTVLAVSTAIDGSITNIISGVAAAAPASEIGTLTALEYILPTLAFGNIATTALGAVNTGDITLGVNSAVDEAATATTGAVQSTLGVVGGSADTGAMMLNVAHNTSIIRGNVENTLVAMNGSVGNINTTALGAVNTGTITSGLNAAVQGIIGAAGQN